ncbi:hypothetical protein [Prochlorococcus marinus]|uniref:hypothetical protein n=1 Tax=Prochlorococcus marinus TaxID=1219 RepID=UPI0022B49706|nr:hypothetical protein [Prochlorococcus marinus]
MNCHLYKKKYVKRISLSEISPLSNFESKSTSSLIYILFRAADNKLKIVFNKKIDQDISNEGFKEIGRKLGSRRDYDLMKLTLKELGHEYIISTQGYKYSILLIRHLNTIGFPTISAKKIFKKKITI